MEPVNSLETADSGSQSAIPLSPSIYVPPTLRDGECYHAFISYSSVDYQWTHSIISRLESCGLQVCYHERDFIPGRTVLENMSECIQESQKVLLVLSPEFVRSRWCLLEANMSLFRDCLERKPIIPVLLQQDISIPLHLCHLTYLEADDPDFMTKLLKVLCSPNHQLQGSTVVPFQPPSLYNGKALQPLTAVNEEGLPKWDCGQFSDMEVPDQLRLIIEDHEKYKEAVRIINTVFQNKVCLRPFWLKVPVLVIVATFFTGVITLLLYGLVVTTVTSFKTDLFRLTVLTFSSFILALFGLISQAYFWEKDIERYIVSEMQKAIGKANAILSEEKVLMGCQSNSKIFLVYVSLDGCKHEFAETFSEQVGAKDIFQGAINFFSPGYACCLAKRHFPFPKPSSSGHLEEGVCFCQYVSQQLSRGEWK